MTWFLKYCLIIAKGSVFFPWSGPLKAAFPPNLDNNNHQYILGLPNVQEKYKDQRLLPMSAIKILSFFC